MTDELYIKIDPATGKTINHPSLASNLMQAFGSIPGDFQPFNRVPFRDSGVTLGVYQVSSCTYTLNTLTNFWEDTWAAVEMTADQKAAKQQQAQTMWANRPNISNFTAWTFDEAICAYVPPIARPTDTLPNGEQYRWQGSTNSWQPCPAYPADGNTYQWNFTTWAWDLVTPPTPSPV